MQEELNTSLLGLSEKQLKESYAKKDITKIAHTYNQMANIAQELFTTAFGFKKVDHEYLELIIQDCLLELRITDLTDCVYISVGVWEGSKHVVIYRGSSIKMGYGVVKQLIKKTHIKGEQTT